MALGRRKKGPTDEERLALLGRHTSDRSPTVHVEELPSAPAAQTTDLVEEYVAIVGLSPEDVFGVYPIVLGRIGRVGELKGEDTHLTLCIAYRDRPEYESARARYREYLAELAEAGG